MSSVHSRQRQKISQRGAVRGRLRVLLIRPSCTRLRLPWNHSALEHPADFPLKPAHPPVPSECDTESCTTPLLQGET